MADGGLGMADGGLGVAGDGLAVAGDGLGMASDGLGMAGDGLGMAGDRFCPFPGCAGGAFVPAVHQTLGRRLSQTVAGHTARCAAVTQWWTTTACRRTCRRCRPSAADHHPSHFDNGWPMWRWALLLSGCEDNHSQRKPNPKTPLTPPERASEAKPSLSQVEVGKRSEARALSPRCERSEAPHNTNRETYGGSGGRSPAGWGSGGSAPRGQMRKRSASALRSQTSPTSVAPKGFEPSLPP